MNFYRPGSLINLSSINSRIILGAITVVSGFMLLTGFSLSKVFYNNAHSALEERLTGQVYLLMADRELNPSGSLATPQELTVDLMHTAYSQLSGYITQADGSILWQSNTDNEKFIPPITTIEHGKKVFQKYEVNGTPYIGLSIAIFWDLTSQQFPLIYHISDNLSDLNQQITDYQHRLWGMLFLMSAILVITLILILRWGLKPLRDVEREIKAVEQGQQDLLNNTYPVELTPLTQNINQLIQYERQQQLRYQNALSDLAHSLKTPLAIIKGQNFNHNETKSYLNTIEDAVQRMNAIIEYQLQRAAATTPSPHIQYLQLTPIAHSLINSMNKIYHDKRIQFQLDLTPDIQFKIDEGDFMEVLGNLLDNACKWCKNQVSLAISENNKQLHLRVTDNGPGISPDMITTITQRGVRADELTPGHGVGLAIVQDIVSVYRGTIDFLPARTGGLEINVRFQL